MKKKREKYENEKLSQRERGNFDGKEKKKKKK